MSKHTPGPWMQKPYVDGIDIVSHDGSKVAEISDRFLDSVGMPPDNGRLIAAAPKLLAACEKTAAWIEETMYDQDDLSDDAKEILATVKASIAEAKGNTDERLES